MVRVNPSEQPLAGATVLKFQDRGGTPVVGTAVERPQSFNLFAVRFLSTRSRTEQIEAGAVQVTPAADRSVEGRFDVNRAPSRAMLPIFSFRLKADPKS